MQYINEFDKDNPFRGTRVLRADSEAERMGLSELSTLIPESDTYYDGTFWDHDDENRFQYFVAGFNAGVKVEQRRQAKAQAQVDAMARVGCEELINPQDLMD